MSIPLASDYVVKVNGTYELSGYLRLGDRITLCYVDAPCSLFSGTSKRVIYSALKNRTLEATSATINVYPWSKCHSPGEVLDFLDWEDCNFLGVQCEEAEWCM